MRALINFFALRPVFTMRGLRLIWLLVLAQQAAYVASFFGTYGIVSITSTFGPYGSLGPGPWFTIVTLLFNMALNLILVRLLIEVAAAILLRPPPAGTSN